MYKTVVGNNNYEISLTGDLVCLEGYDDAPIINNGFITIKLFGVSRTVSLKWLALVSYFEVKNRKT